MIKSIKRLFKPRGTRDKDVRHHVVITGTGRAGTTFLVELLTHLGLNTGYTPEEISKIMESHSRAGLEWDIRSKTAPYIIKDPAFCGYAKKIIRNKKIALDHVILPFRALEDAAASRVRVVKEHPATELKPTDMWGGLVGTDNFADQAHVLARNVHTLLCALADSFIPVTLLSFPRLVNDAEYCYKKLHPLLGKLKYSQFKKAFDSVSHPEWVHQFVPDGSTGA